MQMSRAQRGQPSPPMISCWVQTSCFLSPAEAIVADSSCKAASWLGPLDLPAPSPPPGGEQQMHGSLEGNPKPQRSANTMRLMYPLPKGFRSLAGRRSWLHRKCQSKRSRSCWYALKGSYVANLQIRRTMVRQFHSPKVSAFQMHADHLSMLFLARISFNA